ncbi:sensor histidine kinase [Alteromonas sediminis]|uniref:histidine kinase n=1 Tax=Alteromonas sediminis TaxID=2259342 RepID=A0A3N5Y113_9ALTE|nr:HAMP domain-containing sensor histidine kinase [Alteromonas sediminis]RPJ66613.1 sensor histidine kinase [Alteromonas sediminis]
MSIKKQLISLIISSVILAIFFAALHGYRNSLKQLESVFDKELKSVAHVIFNLASSTQNMPIKTQSDILFQVTRGGKLESASHNAPSESIGGSSNGLGIVTFYGQRWRTYTKSEDGVSVTVAQPMTSRLKSAEDILLVTILPMVVVVPIIGLLIYYIIQTSLSGLFKLSRQLRIRNSQDLSEINIGPVASELAPVIDRMNNLLTRLASAFEREKQISANAAHELRTPISVLSLTAHNIEQEFRNGSLGTNLIDELKNNIQRQAHVIEQIIALYRYNPEQFNQSLDTVDITQVLQDVISNKFEQIDANRQTIELKGDTEIVRGDYFALYTLFENIISNSIKYSGSGTHILVQTHLHEQQFQVSIEDSGVGITEAEITRIFERFYRTHNNNMQTKGSGLGLSIAKHIVDLHGGSIQCTQAALGGLKTIVVLPLARK